VRKRQERKLIDKSKGELEFKVRGFDVDPSKIDRWMKRNQVDENLIYAPSPAACKSVQKCGSLMLIDLHKLPHRLSIVEPSPNEARQPPVALSHHNPHSLNQIVRMLIRPPPQSPLLSGRARRSQRRLVFTMRVLAAKVLRPYIFLYPIFFQILLWNGPRMKAVSFRYR